MLKIMLDPGHGQYENQSPLDKSFYEGTNNYKYALVLKEALLAYEGVEVYMTKNSIAENPSLADRGKMAGTKGCDVFLSIHSNAATAAAYGVEGYYSVKTPKARDLLSGLCNIVRNNLPASKVRRVVTKTNANGTDYYGVLRSSADVKYSMLIEQGFHTNKKELACIRLDEWHKVVAKGQAQVFADFFGLKLKPKTSAPEKHYRVQVGYFSVKKNAENLANELKTKGYSVLIKEE